MANAIVLENQKQGSPQSEWDLVNGPSTRIEGFATDISVNKGGRVDFKINTDSRNYRIDIYRLGYYGGLGARKVATLQHQAATAVAQPNPVRDAATGLVDAGNWQVTDSWAAPADLTSGLYVAKLVRQDGTTGENHIPFIIRDDARASDIVFQFADTTWQAYNGWGGANLYGGNGPATGAVANGRSYAVSYNRPLTTREGGGVGAGPQDHFMGVEYSSLRWMEQNGYDVSYISGVDADRFGHLLLNHKLYVSNGHDEYWSAQQRANVEAARDAGVNLAFFGGNDVYWKTRWEDSIDGNGTPYRTLVTYKETRAGGKIDPSPEWTGTWRDPTFDPSGGGGQPENGLIGTMFQVDSFRADAITIPYPQTQLRFWRNTDVANTAPGGEAELVRNILGYEWNIAPDNFATPDGLVRLSTTTLDVNSLLLDYGTATGAGTATHNLTLYRAPSGALVFSSGTVYWSWGLDDNHDLQATPTDPNIQQAMVNLFADMGVQPETLQASLRLASRSTDFTAPTSSIAPPPVGSGLQEGQRITITGTAADTGGRVAAVEVSTDGGLNWWATSGTPSNWSYTWTAPLAGTYRVLTRAVDDSLNMETPGAGVSVTVAPASRVTLFQPGDLPATVSTNDSNAIEVGVKFTSARSGTISGIRFYKGTGNTGTHVGHLWTATGTLLGSATFGPETATGWQQVNFATPVKIAANTLYVASYHAPNGRYSNTPLDFEMPHTSGPLTVPASDWRTGPNGVYSYGPSGTFPTERVQASTNFWVDVVFNPASETGNRAPVATADTGFTARRGSSFSIQAAALLANDTDPDGDLLTITGVSGGTNGTASYDAIRQVVSFTPNAGYTGPAQFSYTVTDGRAGTATGTVSLNVTEPPPTYTLFAPTATPAILSDADSSAIEVGVRFQASIAGAVAGIRFYKGGGNTGIHVGNLWSANGTLLASATFTAETASGWQQVNFATPVNITAGTTYVASYHAPNGRYSSTSGYFNTSQTNGPLTAPGGGNGVFSYGTSRFPTSSFNNANYWVDVVFERTGGPNRAPVAVADSGFEINQNTSLVIPIATLLANDSDPDNDILLFGGVSGATNGTASYNASAQTVTFTPSTGYTGPASFTYSISDGQNGTASATVGLSVLAPGPTTNFSLFRQTDTPAVASVNDPGAVELGVRFQAAAPGAITGIRFYKGTANTGTHAGHLWTANGTLLASATFGPETASGWQQVNFATPVSIAAGTTYVASYHTTAGNYAVTPGYFQTARSNGQLSAPAGSNGVFSYGNSGTFPTSSFNSTNYWVDVVFQGRNRAPVAVADDDFFTNQGVALVIPVASLLANDSDPDGEALTVTGVSGATNGTATFNAAAQTITFTPAAGYNGPASFTYSITDGKDGTSSAAVAISVEAPSPFVQLFSRADRPATASVNDPSPVELGVRFTAANPGLVTGIRFYKGTANTGTHTGHLWSTNGTLLASATFGPETASGWQQVNFATPVSITAGTTYVASYHTTSGNYAVSSNFFSTTYSNGPLTAPGGSNGVYAYGPSGSFPTGSFNNTNYWVDVVFDPRNQAPVAVADSGFTTTRDTALVLPFSALLGNDTDPENDPLTITGVSGASNGTATLDATARTVTFTPGTGHTGAGGFTYAISDGRGGTASGTVGLTVEAPVATNTLFAATDTPAVASVNDPSQVTLGVKFQADSAGAITGIRFYKGAANTGTHTGQLWTANGALLASATFGPETASGWQQVRFASPVSVTAGTTYVASYHTTSGNYAASPGYFASPHSSGPLTAPSSAQSGGNGVYAYGGLGNFPSGSFNSTNYWVDAVFQGQLAA